jgi:hypothetical protein
MALIVAEDGLLDFAEGLLDSGGGLFFPKVTHIATLLALDCSITLHGGKVKRQNETVCNGLEQMLDGEAL